MRGLARVVTLLTLAAVQPATANDWAKFNVLNTSDGTYGSGAKVSGLLEDTRGARPAELVVTCADNTTRVFISADYLVFGGDVARAEFTIDNGPLQRAYWNVCAGDLCAGPRGKVGIQFLKSLLDASVVKVTLTRQFGGPIHAIFPVYGARDALREVGQRCGWMAP
jgi:hypothetical protein